MIKYILLSLPLIIYGAAYIPEEGKGIAMSRYVFKTPPKKKITPFPASSPISKPEPEIVYGGRWAYFVPRTQLLLKGYDGSPLTRLKRQEASEEVIDGE